LKLVRRLTVALLAVFTLLFAAHAWLTIREFVKLYERDAARDHRVLERALAAAIEATWNEDGRARTLALIEAANEAEPATRIRFVEPGARGATTAALPEGLSEAIAAQRAVVRIDRPPGAESQLFTYAPVHAGGRLVGALELQESLRDESEYVRSHEAESLAAAVALVLVCGGISWALGMRFVGGPVTRLIEHSRRVGTGNLEARVEVRGSDELSELGAELNLMTERLAQAREHSASEARARIAALEAIRHADRLTTAGRLASGIAHELGTPMNVVAGRAQMLAIGEVEGPESVRATAEIIVDQVRRMTRIVRQLLDFARRRGSEPVPTNLSDLVSRALELLVPLAAERGVRLRARDDSAGITALIDPDQIHQVLVNLVMNAVQSCGEGGEVRVRIARGHDAQSTGAEQAWIEVEDDGAGMTPDVIERVFDPFFTTKPVGEGTGLGLAVAYGIVADHGGRFEVESAPGQGSRFRVVLPGAA